MSTRSEPDTQRDLEESAEELYEDAPCGYVSYLPSQGTIVRMNRTLARWLGHEAGDWVGTKRFQALLSPPARLAHETRHLPMLRMRGAVSGLALEMLRADGERMPVLITSQLKYGVGGVPALVRTTIFDASAYHRYERQLVEERDRAQQAADEARRARVAADAANEGKSRFLAAMNHEYRTPINIIAGFAELLAASEVRATDAERAEYLGEMRAASLHLLGLLEDATRYGRLDELERSPRLGPARLRSVAGGGLRLARPVIDARAVEVVLEAGEDDPEVLSNPAIDEAIACVLRDIARRARAHTGLRIIVRAAGDGGAIELRGSALGESEAALQALVSPLDAPEVLGRGLEGSGLGIAFAERVLHICGGSLVRSHSAEGGFSLVLRFRSVLGKFGPECTRV